MGPHGLVASYLHRSAASPPGQAERRGGRDRLRAEGAGPNRELPFTDRVIATLVVLRFQLPHAALALFYGVDRSTITRAVHEIRPLLAARGFAVPGEPGLRLRTLADVFAYAASHGVHLRIDGTEVQVRRPGPATPAAAPSCPARRSRTRSSPPPSAMARGGCYGSGRSARAACTTPPRCAPRASRTCFAATPASPPTSTPDTRAWPATTPARSPPRPRNPGRTPHPVRSPSGKRPANSSPPGGSASSTSSPSPGNGGPCSATPDAANTSKTQPSPSAGWYPTAARTGKDHQPDPPGHHVPPSIAHHVVNPFGDSRCATSWQSGHRTQALHQRAA